MTTPRVLHVLDSTCHETHAQVLAVLRERMGGDRRHLVACVVAATKTRLDPYLNGEIRLAPRRLWSELNLSPTLRRLFKSERADLVHAWGPRAAAAARTAVPDAPILVTLLEPSLAETTALHLRAFDRPVSIVTGSQMTCRRLVEFGVAPERVTVIRGPVDFGGINRAKKQNLRQQLVGDAGPVILLHGPSVRGHGHFEGVWACAIVRQLHPDMRVLLPYASPERGRLTRFAKRMTHDHFPVLPDSRLSWIELASAADLFLAPAMTDICIEPIATAMASGVVTVGCAIHSVAEVIADRHNGLLCRDASLQRLSDRIIAGLEDKSLARQVTDVARSQAFEVFGVRAFVDNYAHAYENVRSDAPIGEGVCDTAMVA
jgi:glycosyltransferase involved in cell wall biosynthesis